MTRTYEEVIDTTVKSSIAMHVPPNVPLDNLDIVQIQSITLEEINDAIETQNAALPKGRHYPYCRTLPNNVVAMRETNHACTSHPRKWPL